MHAASMHAGAAAGGVARPAAVPTTTTAAAAGSLCVCSLAPNDDAKKDVAEAMRSLQQRATPLIDSVRATAAWQLQAETHQDPDDDESEHMRDEAEDGEPSSAPPLVPTSRPPLVCLAELASFLRDVTLAHRQLASHTFVCRLFEQGKWTPPPSAEGAHAVECLPADLVLKLNTRFVLQHLPLLPSLIAALCAHGSATMSGHHDEALDTSFSVELVCLNQPALEALLGLIDQLFLADLRPHDPNLVPKPAVVVQLVPSRNGGMSMNGMPQRPAAIAPGKAREMLSIVDRWLLCLDRKLSLDIWRRQGTIRSERPFSTLDPINLINYLRGHIVDLRSLVRSGVIAGLPVRVPHKSLHARVCQHLLNEFRAYESEASESLADVPMPFVDAPEPSSSFLLSNSFFAHVCHLFYEELSTLAARGVDGEGAAFSNPMLELLDPLIQHACASSAAYDRAHRKQFAFVPPAARPLTSDDVFTTPPSCDFYQGVVHFLNFVRLHRAHILTHPPVSSATRFTFYEHYPDVFELDLIQLLASVALQYSDSQAAEQKVQKLGAAMRLWFDLPLEDICKSPLPSARDGVPKPAGSAAPALAAAMSPFLVHGLSRPVTFEFGPTTPPITFPSSSASWHHVPIALYQYALSITERLATESNAEVCVDILHWLHCVLMQRMRATSEPWKQIHPRSMWPLASMLLSSPNSLSSSSSPFTVAHSGQMLERIWSRVQGFQQVPEPTFPISCVIDVTQGGDATTHLQAGPDDTAVATAAARAHSLRRCMVAWLLLSECRHWLDYAYFLFSQPAVAVDSSLFVAAVSLVAFHVAPVDTRMFELVRSQLTLARQTPLGGESAVANFCSQLWSATECLGASASSLRSHLLALVSPCVANDGAKMLVSQLFALDHDPDLAYAYLVRCILAWICGGIIAQMWTSLPAQHPTDASSAAATSSSVLPTLSFKAAIALHVIFAQVRTRGPKLRPSSFGSSLAPPSASGAIKIASPVRATNAALHAQLGQVFGLRQHRFGPPAQQASGPP